MQDAKNSKGFTVLHALLVIITAVILGFTGWYVWHSKQNADKSYSEGNSSSVRKITSPTGTSEQQQSSFVLPTGWLWDEHPDKGFKYAYPSSWSTPKLDTNSGDTGQSYRISFYPGPSYTQSGSSYAIPSRNQIILGFDTDNYSFQACNDSGHCSQGGSYTSEAKVEKLLGAIKNGTAKSSYSMNIVYHDNTAFATISTDTEAGSTDSLEEQRVVSLPKLNVSAVFGQYFVLDSQTDCVENDVSPNSQKWCINQDVLQTMKKVMQSFTALN